MGTSLPSRERGLKFAKEAILCINAKSLPSRERGLKLNGYQSGTYHNQSLPSRERGLKLPDNAVLRIFSGSLLRGSVD